MKRMFYALMLCLVSIMIVGCSKDQPVTTTGQTVTTGQTETTGSALDDSEGNCLVTIEEDGGYGDNLSDLSIIINDKNGNQKGAGQFYGNYYVPYDGTINLSWTYTFSYYSEEYILNCNCSIPVGSANALNVRIYCGSYYVAVYVGGQIYQRWGI